MTSAELTLTSEVAALTGRVNAFLSGRGVTAYATGGFLRDAILGVRPWDVDISVDGDPLALGRALAPNLGGNYFALDEKRGHARVLVPAHGLHVDLLPLRGDIETDLKTRDYTVDALGARLNDVVYGEAQIIDPTGGLADLQNGVVRCTAEQALKDDPLRVLRGPRIAIERDFTIEPGTERLIRDHAGLLATSAPERQRDELIRMMRTDRAGPAFQLLEHLGLLAVLIPEADVMRGVEQPKEHHWDVFGHALACPRMLDALLSRNEPADPDAAEIWRTLWAHLSWWDGARGYLDGEMVLGSPRRAVIKLCGFLHDIGKPETKTFEENGRMRFFGHSDAGAEIAQTVMKRLHFSARETKFVRRMIEAHLRPVQMAQQAAPTDRAIFRYFRATGEAGIATLFLSLADHLATVGPRRSTEGFEDHVRVVDYILRKRMLEEEVVTPPRLIHGDELISALNIEPGPLVGKLLSAIEEAQAAGDVKTKDEAIDLARDRLERLSGPGRA